MDIQTVENPINPKDLKIKPSDKELKKDESGILAGIYGKASALMESYREKYRDEIKEDKVSYTDAYFNAEMRGEPVKVRIWRFFEDFDREGESRGDNAEIEVMDNNGKILRHTGVSRKKDTQGREGDENWGTTFLIHHYENGEDRREQMKPDNPVISGFDKTMDRKESLVFSEGEVVKKFGSEIRDIQSALDSALSKSQPTPTPNA